MKLAFEFINHTRTQFYPITITQVTQSGTEMALQPEEELVLCDHWLSWLKNLAIECVRKAHLAFRAGSTCSVTSSFIFTLTNSRLRSCAAVGRNVPVGKDAVTRLGDQASSPVPRNGPTGFL